MNPTDNDDARAWREALALFESLRDLPPDARDARLAAAPGDVRERVQRMQAAGDATGPLDRALPGSRPPPRLGRWQIGELIGQGGMSRVFRARSLSAPEGQVSAVKLLALPAPGDDQLARFRRETDILVRLQHPGIAALLDAGIADDGRPWFAMALIEGEPIDAWCRRQSLPPAARVRLVQQVSDAVAHAHRHLVVHRDIKPGNVMVDAGGRAVLLDFGISRVLEEGAAELTSGGSYPFTPRYAAPEQREGGAISTATDVYGLGALLHKLLLDEAPVAGADGEPALPANSGLAADLGAILRKALARDPRARYATATDFGADLDAWLHARPVRARAGGSAYRLRRWMARNPLAAALSVALAASAAIGVGAVLWQSQRATAEALRADQARAVAEQQRAAAESARAGAERERDRAEALNGFILGLFNANLPNRPRDQLPTTAELLDLGAERARDPASGEPAVRAQLLAAIANVHHVRGRAEPARELSAEAVALAREDADPAGTLVAALGQQATVAMQQADFALARAALAEATALQQSLDGDGPRSAEGFGLQRRLAIASAMQQDYVAAAELLQSAWQEAQGRDDLDPALVDSLASALAVTYGGLHRPAEARPLYEHQLARIIAGPKKDSLAHAITLSNLAGNLAELGELALAQQRIDEALALHDRLFDAPSTYRAAARLKQSQIRMRQGQYDQALADADAASLEWARSDGSLPATDAFASLNRLPVLLQAGRWQDLVREAELGRYRLDRNHAPDELGESRLRAEAWAALAHCALGQADAGEALARAARKRLETFPGPDPRLLAATDEAEARCLAARGDRAGALAKLRQAQAHDAAIPPGDQSQVARRAALAADWSAGG